MSRTRHFNNSKKEPFLLLSPQQDNDSITQLAFHNEGCCSAQGKFSRHLKKEKDTIAIKTKCPECVRSSLQSPFTEDSHIHTLKKNGPSVTDTCWVSMPLNCIQLLLYCRGEKFSTALLVFLVGSENSADEYRLTGEKHIHLYRFYVPGAFLRKMTPRNTNILA